MLKAADFCRFLPRRNVVSNSCYLVGVVRNLQPVVSEEPVANASFVSDREQLIELRQSKRLLIKLEQPVNDSCRSVLTYPAIDPTCTGEERGKGSGQILYVHGAASTRGAKNGTSCLNAWLGVAPGAMPSTGWP